MSRWEDMANQCSDLAVEQQIERKQELEFEKQVVELADEGMDEEMIAKKLGIDLEIIEGILRERREHGTT